MEIPTPPSDYTPLWRRCAFWPPSPGDPQAEPTIAEAINGGFDHRTCHSARQQSFLQQVAGLDDARLDSRRQRHRQTAPPCLKGVESRCDAVALGSNISVSAPFVWRCLTGSAMAPFSHPAHRTGQADFPHPALGQDFTPSPTARRAQACSGVRAQSARKDARVDRSRPCDAWFCA
jgi:hypothetical protein